MGKVRCADCGGEFLLEQCDIVDYGTGSRCEKCTLGGEIAGHIEASAANAAARGRDRALNAPSIAAIESAVDFFKGK